MGTFFHPITLIAPSGASETLGAMVDIDTLFAVFPTAVLERLGVQPDQTTRLRINGRERICRLAQVKAELDGREATIMCVFGEGDEPSRIGRHTLDTFLLDANFAKYKLVPKKFRLITHI